MGGWSSSHLEGLDMCLQQWGHSGSSSGPSWSLCQAGPGSASDLRAGSWCNDSDGGGGYRADDLPAGGGRSRRGSNDGGQTAVSDRRRVKGL
jgi:hypothetical protein